MPTAVADIQLDVSGLVFHPDHTVDLAAVRLPDELVPATPLPSDGNFGHSVVVSVRPGADWSASACGVVAEGLSHLLKLPR
jgi:hypothetical protein